MEPSERYSKSQEDLLDIGVIKNIKEEDREDYFSAKDIDRLYGKSA